MKTIIRLSVLVCLLGLTAADPESTPSTQPGQVGTAIPTTQSAAEELKHQVKVSTECEGTVRDIQRELVELAKKFPALKGIDEQKIVVAEVADSSGGGEPVFISLGYEREVTRRKIPPGPDGFVPQNDEVTVVNPNGVLFHLAIMESIIGVGRPGTYALPDAFHNKDLRLEYNLEENPKDDALEAEVQKIIESHVDKLHRSLENSADHS